MLLFTLPALAEPIPLERVPVPLQPWTEWALLGHEGELCPTFLGGEEKRCVWPGVLSLDLTDGGGSFRQEWALEAGGFVPLPGEARRWPLDLQLDGRPAAAVSRQGAPGLWLPAGNHTIVGSFRWDALPESLPVPAEVGVVVLTVRGAPVPFAERDESGRVFLQGARAVQAEEDRLEIRVQRRIVDGIPVLLTTRIELAVSGKAREVLLGRALPDRFIPLSLAGPLPARLEPGGRLRVQVRPGNWVLDVTARGAGPVSGIKAPLPGGPWAPEEVWVFDARPDIRLVDIGGLTAVDPQQTTLPAEWKALPAYRVRPGETMRLAERRRGGADPAADRLTLRRVLWLDFDGGGYTWQDEMQGTLSRSWRLDVAPPARLERVSLGGEDQVITRRPGSDRTGIEVRQGQVALTAEGRLPSRAALPAVGWDHDFHEVAGELRIPPGWRILGALGVDDAPGTWIDQWTLLDLFLVLLLSLAVRHLWGNRWAAVAIAALVLTWHEPGAPRWIWVAVLAIEALRRAITPEGRAGKVMRAASGLALGILALMTVAFLAGQIRQAIYPALEMDPDVGSYSLAASRSSQEGEALGYIGATRDESRPVEIAAQAKKLQEMDPRAVVATGGGLPDWNWHRVELRWSGPVDKDHQVRFLLVSPAANFVLTLVRLALLALLVLRALSAAGLRLERRMPPVLLLCLLLLLPAVAKAQTGPSAENLEQIRQALLAPPDCLPECASSPRMFLEASPGSLRLRFEVGAAADVAVPLPGGVQQWLPAEVRIDGRPAAVARTPDGRIWTLVGPGRHEVLMTGPLPERETVQVPLPLRPHRVDVAANGWTVDGVHEDGQADDNLQLTRVRSGPSDGAFQTGELPPFLEVRRTLVLGLTWRVETRVVRISPAGVPASVAVPLLPGESVTAAGVRVQKGAVQVSLGPQAMDTAWTSTLAPRPELRLAAPRTLAWTEVWRLDASPIWHVEARGIAPLLLAEGGAVRIPEWRPWPGEGVILAVTRPAGVAGQTPHRGPHAPDRGSGPPRHGYQPRRLSAEQPRRPAHGRAAGGSRAAVLEDRRQGAASPAGGEGRGAARASRRSKDRNRMAGAAGHVPLLPLAGRGPERAERQREPDRGGAGEPLGPARGRAAPGSGGPLLEPAGRGRAVRAGAGPGEDHAAGLDPAGDRPFPGSADRRRDRGRLAPGARAAEEEGSGDAASPRFQSAPDPAGDLDRGGLRDPLLGDPAGIAGRARDADRGQRLLVPGAPLVPGPDGRAAADALGALGPAPGLPSRHVGLGPLARPALLRWLRWGWESFTTGGGWRRRSPRLESPPAPPAEEGQT
ncbi:MAG: hypothetical protein QOH06_3822 [Acidobacteriota bacterium]|nr:hypothetical protein [Acidobacteriota bacterium]